MIFELEQAVEILQRTPATLNAWLRGLSAPWLFANEGPETWSPFEVVGHLIHGEETDWMPRLQIILEFGEARPFAPFDRVGFFAKHKSQPLAALLDTFAELRAQNLATLNELHLQPADYARTGMHPALGRVTLAQLLAAWVVHDLGHVRQIARALAKQYHDEVGPWRAYLSILAE